MKRYRLHSMVGCMVVISALFFFMAGCARPGQQRSTAALPPVGTLEEKPAKKPERAPEPEAPTQIEMERLESTITTKTYPGIEGEIMETPSLKDSYFKYDRYDLTPEARATLAENVRILRGMPNVRIQVEGHCDERGTKEYNLALGERRAAAAKNYLVSLEVPEKNISTISLGEEMPVNPRSDEKAWARNRRAHIIILSRN